MPSDDSKGAGRRACPHRRALRRVTFERGVVQRSRENQCSQLRSGPTNTNASPAVAGSSKDPVSLEVVEQDLREVLEHDLREVVVEEEEQDDIAKGSAEEALTKEHHMTHLPKLVLRSLRQCQSQTQAQEDKGGVLLPGTTPK